MANRAITKKISALPTYALNNNNGNLLYSEGGANYQFPLSNIALLSNLGSSEVGKGGALIGMPQGGTVQTVLTKVVTVESFSHLVEGSDWGPAFRAAMAMALNIGATTVTFKGNYIIKASSGVSSWTLPFDDGTYDSRRSGETTLTAETTYSMPVGLDWPSNLSLKSDGIAGNSISFEWDGATVDINQTVGICLRVRNWDGTYVAKAGAVNRMMGDIANVEFDGFTVKNAAIGIVGDGIVGSVTWGVLQFNTCGIPIMWQGGDRCTIKKLRFTNCASGMVVGGWWLTRNDISGSSGGLGVPPYVSGTDVYCIGWCDFVKVESLEFSNSQSWSPNSIYAKIDAFFDTYIYKSANSTKTSSGGRCTNTGTDRVSASTLAADSPFYGISTRAMSQLGRYHRYHILNEIISLKTWGCARASVLTTYNGSSELNVPGCIVGTAYCEQGGKLDQSVSNYTVGGTNDFITSGGDLYANGKTYTKYYVGEGSVVVTNGWPINTLGMFPAARTVARNDNGYSNRLRRTILDDGTGKTVIPEQLSPDVYITPPQKFIPNAVGTVDSRYYWQHIQKNVTSKMTLYAGIPVDTTQATVTASTSKAFMERLGNRVKLKIAFDSSNYATGGTNPMVIGFTNIYAPLLAVNDNEFLTVYGPVKTILISSVAFTVTDSNNVTRTFRIEPVAYQAGGFRDSAGVTHYYFILQNQRHSSDTYRFLWSHMSGSLCRLEIEYDTLDAITSSNVF